ncbi:hypothetical protein GCM10007049_35530 [Echinicola pacifica]|uniref:DUF4625 domain-containing protein n=2 Tax=Echinicola pacifica TaxID=346377 RepID=A0A918QBG6_9BACT|nr:hypothetical protein GCM10007049_35530 [Echinicola pacifica]
MYRMKNRFVPLNKNVYWLPLFIGIGLGAVFSCSQEEDMEPRPASFSELEIGSGDNRTLTIGQDFHLNVQVLAENLIESVGVRIEQQADKLYDAPWNFEIQWEEFEGLKNTTVHKHFMIPAAAVEGEYLFTLYIKDQNGSLMEESYLVQVRAAENPSSD